MKNKITTIGIILTTLVLAGIAIFTAIRLYNLRQQSVAPTAPESKPEAAVPQSCTALTFTISGRPDLCKSAAIDKTTLKPGESVTISSTTNSNADLFYYAFYNKDNLYPAPDGTPKPICVKTGGDITDGTSACPSGSHHLIFKDPSTTPRTTGSRTLKYEDIFVIDENNGGKKVERIQINAYFSISGGAGSYPKPECVVAVTSSDVTTAACNETCSGTIPCQTGLTCTSGVCRNSTCSSETDCTCGTTPAGCNTSCTGTGTGTCQSDLVCISNLCRHPDCTSDIDCLCTKSCNQSCGNNSDCASGLSCISSLCRNSSCSTETDCDCTTGTATGTATPTLPDAGISTPTILGIGIGTILLIISLALAL
jgi:hypothetical protein